MMNFLGWAVTIFLCGLLVLWFAMACYYLVDRDDWWPFIYGVVVGAISFALIFPLSLRMAA
jgi:hypothetical protein